jgi:hypothetical protein
MLVELWTATAVIPPSGCVQTDGEYQAVAVVVKSKISMPDNDVGGSCPAVGKNGVPPSPGLGVMVNRGVSVVDTTVTVGPAPGMPVRLASVAPTSVPEA